MNFRQLVENILEALQGVDPKDVDNIISTSFKDVVISDLLADASVKETPTELLNNNLLEGSLIDSRIILNDLKSYIPALFTTGIDFNIDSKFNRVALSFDEDGEPNIINIPQKINKDLGPVIILHELSHVLYSIDIITNEMVQSQYSAQAFTLARTIEDVRTEKILEQEYPETKTIFKERSRYIIPLYKKHTPSQFSKIVDSLFLRLRGYSSNFNYPQEFLDLAQQFIDIGNDRDKKVKTILLLTNKIMSFLVKDSSPLPVEVR